MCNVIYNRRGYDRALTFVHRQIFEANSSETAEIFTKAYRAHFKIPAYRPVTVDLPADYTASNAAHDYLNAFDWCRFDEELGIRQDENPRHVFYMFLCRYKPEVSAVLKKKSRDRLEIMQQNLESKGWTFLASGAYSKVYEHEDFPEEVIKISKRVDLWPLFVKWGIDNGYAGTFTPAVTSLKHYKNEGGEDFYVARMKKIQNTLSQLDHTGETEDFREIHRFANNTIRGREEEPNGKMERIKWNAVLDYVNGVFAGLYDFACNFRKTFQDFGFDLHEGNWMTDNMSNLILTDPITRGEPDDMVKSFAIRIRSGRTG